VCERGIFIFAESEGSGDLRLCGGPIIGFPQMSEKAISKFHVKISSRGAQATLWDWIDEKRLVEVVR